MAQPWPPIDRGQAVERGFAEAESPRGIGKFGATRALDDVDFSALGGETHARVGENGAGKSALIGIFGGRYRQDRGEIDLVLILDEPRAALERQGIERLFRALGRMKRLGVAIIYISPRLDEIVRLAEQRDAAKRAIAAPAALVSEENARRASPLPGRG